MEKNVHYNYELNKCNWLLKQGVTSVGCGVGKKGNYFNVFIVSAKYKKACKYYDDNINNDNLTKENDIKMLENC